MDEDWSKDLGLELPAGLPPLTDAAVEARRAELELEPHRLAWQRIERAISSADGSPPDRAAIASEVREALRLIEEEDVRGAMARDAENLAKEHGLDIRAAEMLRELRRSEKAESGGAEKARQGREIALEEPEPWLEPVDGAEILDELACTFSRYLVLPPGAVTILPLFTVHTYTHEAAEASPHIVLKSAVRQSGKTKTLEVLGSLVPRPISTASITPAALFRVVEKFQPTLLVDEADSVVASNEELRALLNAGHTRTSAYVVRTVGERHEPRLFFVWCPKVIALIGRLPDTTEDRSIIITMRRKTKDERVERLRREQLKTEKAPLRRMIARWASDYLDALRGADPDVPDELNDRAQDNWRPLLAIADLAGGDWPERAREAALKSVQGVEDEGSARLQVLADIRELFAERGTNRLPSSEIVEALVKLEDRPWPEWRHGQPLSTAALARLLRPFGVRPKPMDWRGEYPKGTRGYALKDLADAFNRYCYHPAEPQPPQPSNSGAGFDGFPNRNLGGQGCTLENAEKQHDDCKVAEVALREGGVGAGPGLEVPDQAYWQGLAEETATPDRGDAVADSPSRKQGVRRFPSQSRVDRFHEVARLDGGTLSCSCESFRFRGRCRHVGLTCPGCMGGKRTPEPVCSTCRALGVAV